MMKIGFIDFSKEERNKVLSTLRLLGDSNAIDELGIGTMRDAYADILFPGISTLHTRAKYFVIIPYLFQEVAKRKCNSGEEVLRTMRDMEIKLIKPLFDNSVGDWGVIGSNSMQVGQIVKNKPSAIYWNGLRTYEILKDNRLTLSSACNKLYQSNKNKISIQSSRTDDGYDDISASRGSGVIFTPIELQYDLYKDVCITLTCKEAKFIYDKIMSASASKNTLLSYMLENRYVVDSFEDIQIDKSHTSINRDFILARNFATFINGAHIRYNCIFSNYQDENMHNRFVEWHNQFLESDIDIEAILDRVAVNIEVKTFCREFYNAVITEDITRIDDIIISREKRIKGSRSKLNKPSEYKYNSERPIHNFILDYRYGTAKTIIQDIIKGLEKKDV